MFEGLIFISKHQSYACLTCNHRRLYTTRINQQTKNKIGLDGQCVECSQLLMSRLTITPPQRHSRFLGDDASWRSATVQAADQGNSIYIHLQGMYVSTEQQTIEHDHFLVQPAIPQWGRYFALCRTMRAIEGRESRPPTHCVCYRCSKPKVLRANRGFIDFPLAAKNGQTDHMHEDPSAHRKEGLRERLVVPSNKVIKTEKSTGTY